MHTLLQIHVAVASKGTRSESLTSAQCILLYSRVRKVYADVNNIKSKHNHSCKVQRMKGREGVYFPHLNHSCVTIRSCISKDL